MNEAILTTIAVTGFTVAFFHAAIPTHWLPFVAAARSQHWSATKTLSVTALAGGGHVMMTAFLGFLLTAFGFVIDARVGAAFPFLAGGLLIGLGLFYWWRQFRGSGRGHSHGFGLHSHSHHSHGAGGETEGAPHSAKSSASDQVAIGSLFALLTFSPCEGFLPIYVSGIRFGWSGFALLTLILSIATLAGMMLFTSLAFAGLRSVRSSFFERWESGFMGSLLLLIGVLVILFEK
ncbi:MAG: hypothetical protein ABI839_01315 [Verrucomicrobiota bacterium]